MKKKKAKRKKVKRKVVKKKAVKRKKRKAVYIPPCYGLHQKKLEILRVVPIMPCSAIDRDMQGLRFAHTQAEKVYRVYRRECESRGLVIRRIKGTTTNGERPAFIQSDDKRVMKAVPCVRFEGVWEICDVSTGETETFGGAGDGDNEIWSANSAQTIARKQALLDYFETAWPQPTNWLKLVRDSLEEAGPEEFVKAMKSIVPEKIAEATGIIDVMGSYFDKVFAKKKGAKKNDRVSSKRKG